jgi:hypothetical protein
MDSRMATVPALLPFFASVPFFAAVPFFPGMVAKSAATSTP